MKSNLILVFLFLAPLVQHLLTTEAAEDRASAPPAQTSPVERKPEPAKTAAQKKEPEATKAPVAPVTAPQAGGCSESGGVQRLPARDAVTFM